jgi:transcriptional regulator with GAF, ATPase, and Fis domain
LRVIKNNTLRYQSFYKSLPFVSSSGSDRGLTLPTTFNFQKSESNNNYEHFEELFSLQKKIKEIKSAEEVLSEFENSVKQVISCEEVNLFLFDDTQSALAPAVKGKSPYSISFVTSALKEGILDWILETNTLRLIPAFNFNKANGKHLNYIIFPLTSEKKYKGVITVLTQLRSFAEDSTEAKVISSMGEMVFCKVELLKKD